MSNLGCNVAIKANEPAILIRELGLVLCPECNDNLNPLEVFGDTYYVYQEIIPFESVKCGYMEGKNE